MVGNKTVIAMPIVITMDGSDLFKFAGISLASYNDLLRIPRLDFDF
jgi:hypothetical protein